MPTRQPQPICASHAISSSCLGSLGSQAVFWSSLVATVAELYSTSGCGLQTPGSFRSRQILECVSAIRLDAERQVG